MRHFMVEKTIPDQKKSQVTEVNTEDNNVYIIYNKVKQLNQLLKEQRMHESLAFLQTVSAQKYLIQSAAKVKAPVLLVTLMPV